jgi:hypothetical protein
MKIKIIYRRHVESCEMGAAKRALLLPAESIILRHLTDLSRGS